MSQSKEKTRFPDARLKAMDEFFDLMLSEPDWKPSTINIDTFKTLGIARSKEGNAIFALKFLGIIDRNGIPTENYDNLRNDFHGTLKRLVRTSYTKLFETIPLSRMNQQTLVNFFMTYRYSEETAEYQAKLFVYLCEHSGIDLPNIEKSFQRARFQKNK